MLGQKGDTFDVRPFEEIMKSNEVKLPLKIDPTLILDGGRVLEWLAPIPTSGEGKMVNKTTGVYDVGTAGWLLWISGF